MNNNGKLFLAVIVWMAVWASDRGTYPYIKFLRGAEFFAEAGTVDVYLWYKSMSHRIKFRQIFSLAIGVNLLLDHE